MQQEDKTDKAAEELFRLNAVAYGAAAKAAIIRADELAARGEYHAANTAALAAARVAHKAALHYNSAARAAADTDERGASNG